MNDDPYVTDDIDYAKFHKVDFYVVGPSLDVYYYDVHNDTISDIGSINPVCLSELEKKA